jgi:hypothetical protein
MNYCCRYIAKRRTFIDMTHTDLISQYVVTTKSVTDSSEL